MSKESRNRSVHDQELIDWEDVVKCIPKDVSVIPDFALNEIEKNIKFNDELRILDIGGGAGRLAKSIIEKYVTSAETSESLFGCPFRNIYWSLIERVPEMKVQYEKRLKSIAADINFTSISDNRISKNSREDIDNWFTEFKKTYGKFDLIIASHVTYYFSDGGLCLAKNIVNNLLNPGGMAWFIVRDNNCEYYQSRASFLGKNNFRDLHSHQFASYFNAFAYSMFPKVISKKEYYDLKPDQETNYEKWKKTVRLTWHLDDIDETLLDKKSLEGIKKGFAEQHILISGISDELSLQESWDEKYDISLSVANCVLEFFRIDPNADVLRCSISVGSPDYQNTDEQLTVKSGGFTLECDNAIENYFDNSDNLSFMMLRQFFYDEPIGYSTEDNDRLVLHNVAWVEELCSMPKTKKRNRISIIVPNSIVLNKDSNHDWMRLKELWEVWVELLSEGFESISSTCHSSATKIGGPVWTLAVGAELCEDRNTISKSKNMPDSRVALFMTVQFEKEKDASICKQKMHEAAMRMKAPLLRHLAQIAYVNAEERERRSDIYQKRFESLHEPLKQISKSLRTVSNSVHGLETLLYDPQSSIFIHHKEIGNYFKNDFKIKINETLAIRAKHSFEYTSATIRSIMLYMAILTLLGENDVEQDDEIKNTKELRRVAQLLKEKIKKTRLDIRKKHVKEEEVCCLIDLLTNQSWIPDNHKDFSFINPDEATVLLGIIKNTFVSPFKPETETWHISALYVIFWNTRSIPKLIYETARSDNSKSSFSSDFSSVNIKSCQTPLSYANLLAFFREILLEFYSRQETVTVTKVTIKSNKPSEAGSKLRCILSIEIEFSEDYLEYTTDISTWRNQIMHFVRKHTLTNSWTMVPFGDDSLGDTLRPWVDLVSCIEAYSPGWIANIRYKRDMLRYRNGNYEFAISLPGENKKQNRLFLEWTETWGGAEYV